MNAEKSVDLSTQLNFASTNDVVGGNTVVNRAIAVDVTGITEALKNIYHADRLAKELMH
jgi:Peptidase S46